MVDDDFTFYSFRQFDNAVRNFIDKIKIKKATLHNPPAGGPMGQAGQKNQQDSSINSSLIIP